jgi:hypothetical protein
MTRAIALSCFLLSLLFANVHAQNGGFQFAAHAGVNQDGTFLLGGQVGVRLIGFATATVTGTFLPTVHDAMLTEWDGSLRLTPWDSKVRPYLLVGIAFDHSTQSGFPTRNDWGVVGGAGLEAGRGRLRGFAEARVVRVGSVFSTLHGYTGGRFWAGVRIHTGL